MPCQLPTERWELQSLEKTQRQSSSFDICFLFSRCYLCTGCRAWGLETFFWFLVANLKVGVIWGRVYFDFNFFFFSFYTVHILFGGVPIWLYLAHLIFKDINMGQSQNPPYRKYVLSSIIDTGRYGTL